MRLQEMERRRQAETERLRQIEEKRLLDLENQADRWFKSYLPNIRTSLTRL